MIEPRRLTIDIWSDVMCPWCIIGYRNLLKALDELEGEFQCQLPRRLQLDVLICRRRTHVRQLLALAGVNVEVARTDVFTYDHPAVHFIARTNEHGRSLLKFEESETHRRSFTVRDENALLAPDQSTSVGTVFQELVM